MPERYAPIANRQFGNQALPLLAAILLTDACLHRHTSVDDDPAGRWLCEQLISTVEGVT